MGRFYIPPRGIIDPRVVPTLGPVRLNREHPLAQGLVGLWLPGVSGGNLIDSGPALIPSNAPVTAGSSLGPGMAFNGTNQYATVSGAAGMLPLTQVSVYCGVIFLAVGSGTTANSNIFEFDSDSNSWGFQALLSGDHPFLAAIVGTTQTNLIGATALSVGEVCRLAFTYTGSQLRLFVNGVEDANSPLALTGTLRGPGQLLTLATTGPAGFSGRYANAIITDFRVSGQASSPALAALDAAEPFGMLREIGPPILYSFAGGGGGTLVGTAAATSTATGTLAGAGTLAGTSAAASTATGTLAGAGLLIGAAAAASTATGTLSGGAYLTGTAAATSTATGTLAGAGALTGTAAATSTATGTLSSGAYLVGTAAATSTATGTLAGAGALAGTAAATSAATATLAGSGALAGTSAATSTATGTLTTATSLVGRADAISTATGTLAGAGRMTGTAAATSTAPAFLIGFGPISGIAAATSTATGTLASRSWVFRAGRIVSIPADIRTAAIPADIRTVQ